METFICEIPTLEELIRNWDREIAEAGEDRENWLVWKQRSIDNYLHNRIIPYFGILDGKVISQAVAHIDPENVQNSDGLVDETTAYLSAFRTVEACQGHGYFSKLFRFMMEDLKCRGYEKVTLGVEPEETENLAIYTHYGFAEFIKKEVETFPDGTTIQVDYYGKQISE